MPDPLASALLLVAIVSLFVGPGLYTLWPQGRSWRAMLDGLALSMVVGLCLLHLLPHAMAHAGFPALGAALLAAMVPRMAAAVGLDATSAWRALVALGFAAHAALDGAALSVLGDPSLALAVAAHRLPVGLVIFASVGGSTPKRGWLAVSGLAVATLMGFGLAQSLPLGQHSVGEGLLAGVVAGSLLHISLHAHSEPEITDASGSIRPLWLAGGMLLGAAAVLAVVLGAHNPTHSGGEPMPTAQFIALAALGTALAAIILRRAAHQA